MSYVKGTYSTSQQVYAFNQTINVAFGVTEFTSDAALQQFVNKVLSQTLSDPTFQQYMGNDWQMLWGPIVYTNNPGTNSVVADNTMALFYSPNQNMYVVAIAGTNIDSAYGWMQEDFNVSKTELWSDVMGSGFTINSGYTNAAISVGSNLGLQGLLGMQAGTTTMLSALTTSLNGLPTGSQVKVYVSGHSLGGALSPVVALYMHDAQQLSGNWNTKGYATQIIAMPSAGPTPGEVNFAGYYTYQCGQAAASGSAGIAYTSVYNTLDIVPHAWQKDEIGEIVGIYSGNIPNESAIGAISIGAFLKGCNTSKTVFGITIPEDTYTQVSAAPAVRTALTGSFNSTIDGEVTKKNKGLSLIVPTPLFGYATDFINVARFLVQAGYQHTIAYSGDPSTSTNGLLQVVEVVGVEQKYKQQDLPSGQTETQLHEAAIARVTGIDLQSMDTSELPEAQGQAK